VYEIDQEKCKKVGDCVTACPVEAIEKKDDGKFNVSDDCTDCGACEPACDAKAIHHVQ
jgi:MinD superfamily P-loop ATPase